MGGHTAIHAQPSGYQAPMTAFAPHVTRLRLTHFRSHQTFDLDCAPGAVVMTGENGIGKTNVLEALSMLAPGRGLRSAKFDEMRFERRLDWTVAADIVGPHGEMKAGVALREKGRHVRIDASNGKIDDIAQYLPQLWLTPAMDRLFVDAASGRRKFLDRFAQSLDAGLAACLSGFEKAMRERNKLLGLCDGRPDAAQSRWLEGLEETMALHATAIAAARLAALDALAVGLAAVPDAAFPRAEISLSGALEADLRRRSALDVEDDYRALLAAQRAPDAAAGRALEGPHRSDLLVSYAAKAMPASACSTGEQKALLVGLILAQAHSVAEKRGAVPLLLLDEVTAHLDRHRRGALADILAALGGQSWITGTDREMFGGFETAFGARLSAVALPTPDPINRPDPINMKEASI